MLWKPKRQPDLDDTAEAVNSLRLAAHDFNRGLGTLNDITGAILDRQKEQTDRAEDVADRLSDITERLERLASK